MNQSHLPRLLINLLFMLVAATFFAGVLRAFAPARAALVNDNLAQTTALPTSTSLVDFPSPGPALTLPPASSLPPPTRDATSLPTSAPTDTSTPLADTEVYPDLDEEPIYITDMTGIIALGILMVVVVLVGMAWGVRNPGKNK
jgi:hypothetical protein